MYAYRYIHDGPLSHGGGMYILTLLLIVNDDCVKRLAFFASIDILLEYVARQDELHSQE